MKKLLFTVFSLLLTVFHLTAQKFETALAALTKEHQPEKIYFQYDKEYYVAGETIWFKAYLYSNSKPSATANNLYLQFIDSKGRIVRNKKSAITA